MGPQKDLFLNQIDKCNTAFLKSHAFFEYFTNLPTFLGNCPELNATLHQYKVWLPKPLSSCLSCETTVPLLDTVSWFWGSILCCNPFRVNKKLASSIQHQCDKIHIGRSRIYYYVFLLHCFWCFSGSLCAKLQQEGFFHFVEPCQRTLFDGQLQFWPSLSFPLHHRQW